MNSFYKDWSSYSFFFSAEYSQDFLKKSYLSKGISDAEKNSFDNCYPFIYYLEHGKIYFEQAELSPFILKPILLFYGLVHLIKACILTLDPLYPENTSVLAHGVSARKRKKQNYQFFRDEVKFQKNGLYPHLSEVMFHMKQLEGEKANMEELLSLIPELDPLFKRVESKSNFTMVSQIHNELLIPEKILDRFHMTDSRFGEYLISKSGIPLKFQGKKEKQLIFRTEGSIFTAHSPFKFNLDENKIVFPLAKTELFHFPELMIHYLLLYNLSMIARYETEWWSELIKTMPNRDYPFIYSFLDCTLKKSPFLIFNYLLDGN